MSNVLKSIDKSSIEISADLDSCLVESWIGIGGLMTVVTGHTFKHSTFNCFLFLFWTLINILLH